MSDQMSSPALHHRFATASGPTGDEELTALVAGAQAGDQDGFRRLYGMHLPAVYAYCLARLGSRQDAEDVTAQAFERAWRSLRQYRPTGSFAGWLFTLVRRTLADHYRRRRPQTVPVEGLADTLVDPAVGAEEQIVAGEQTQWLWRAIGELNPEQQDVIALRFMAELPYRDIAQVLGKSEPAVKMLAYRALAEVRRRYENEDPVSTEK